MNNFVVKQFYFQFYIGGLHDSECIRMNTATIYIYSTHDQRAANIDLHTDIVGGENGNLYIMFKTL